MNRLKSMLATLVMLLCTISASAHDFEVDGIYYNITDSEKLTVEVTYRGSHYYSYSEYTGDVVIPETVTYESKTYAVTSIGFSAFRSCRSLTSITIPNSVTSIGNYAFSGCDSLTSVTIPEGVTSIGDNAFSYCSSLTSVHISDITAWCNIKFGSYDSNPLYYAKHLYMNGKEITELIIPDGVTSIANYAFYNCSSLTSVTIPNGVTSIGERTFYNCSSLTSVTIPNSVTSIGDGAFEGTAWYNNQPDGVVYAGKVAYKYKGTMPSNTSIELAEGTLGIAGGAFQNCSSLTSITIPEGVTSIGNSAFYNCSSLTSIIIPNSVTSIGEDAFYNCSLTSVHISDIAAWCNIKFSNGYSNPLHFAKHLFIDGKEITELKIPDGVTSIGNYVFCYCSSLTSITIPNSVTSIGDYAFGYCRSLTSITIPNSVINIGKSAFLDCRSLTSVTIPNSVTSIGSSAFFNCLSLTSVTIPNGVTSIGSSTFYNCTSLISVTIPNGVTSIGRWAFDNCSSLSSITIPNSVTSIGDEAFYNCSSLTSVKVLAETPPVAYITTFDNYDIELCVPEKSLEIYKATSPWSSFVNIIALAPPSTTSLTIGSTGSTTFSSIYNLDFSNVEGLKAYTATGYNSDNGEITLVRIKEAKAGSGLYVSGTPGTYTIPIISSTAYNSLNMFVGVNEETTISTTDGIYTNYIYTKPTGKEAGFYKVTSDRAIPAGKAYLQIPTAWLNEETASEAKAVKLMFDDGESTGIDEVNRVEESKEEVIYDLQGRRVLNPSKGIYIINGKKVVR